MVRRKILTNSSHKGEGKYHIKCPVAEGKRNERSKRMKGNMQRKEMKELQGRKERNEEKVGI